uniref:(northern house mosquito) hypothetical protein n=1 Tax=Culex pipiens TaxID=7175 RepID=A0A8D8HGB2_CULPI
MPTRPNASASVHANPASTRTKPSAATPSSCASTIATTKPRREVENRRKVFSTATYTPSSGTVSPPYQTSLHRPSSAKNTSARIPHSTPHHHRRVVYPVRQLHALPRPEEPGGHFPVRTANTRNLGRLLQRALHLQPLDPGFRRQQAAA